MCCFNKIVKSLFDHAYHRHVGEWGGGGGGGGGGRGDGRKESLRRQLSTKLMSVEVYKGLIFRATVQLSLHMTLHPCKM